MAEKAQKAPAWGYKIEGGKVVSRIFDDGELPQGWKDTPAGMAEKVAKAS